MRSVPSAAIPFAVPFVNGASWSLLDQGEKENARQSTHPIAPKGPFLLIKDSKVYLRESKEAKPARASRYSPRSSSLGLLHARNGLKQNYDRDSELDLFLTETAPLTEAMPSPSMPPLSPAYSQMDKEDTNVMEMLNVIEAEVGTNSPSMPPLSPDNSLMESKGKCKCESSPIFCVFESTVSFHQVLPPSASMTSSIDLDSPKPLMMYRPTSKPSSMRLRRGPGQRRLCSP